VGRRAFEHDIATFCLFASVAGVQPASRRRRNLSRLPWTLDGIIFHGRRGNGFQMISFKDEAKKQFKKSRRGGCVGRAAVVAFVQRFPFHSARMHSSHAWVGRSLTRCGSQANSHQGPKSIQSEGWLNQSYQTTVPILSPHMMIPSSQLNCFLVFVFRRPFRAIWPFAASHALSSVCRPDPSCGLLATSSPPPTASCHIFHTII
jgi:hypothetical protein